MASDIWMHLSAFHGLIRCCYNISRRES
ncbi:hypothetical protein NC653_011327 [Populus alba x Populus x berolinensis]|nr:hypothetical protein NC653_011327 [Populus alba x Populus x berolinensis]